MDAAKSALLERCPEAKGRVAPTAYSSLPAAPSRHIGAGWSWRVAPTPLDTAACRSRCRHHQLARTHTAQVLRRLAAQGTRFSPRPPRRRGRLGEALLSAQGARGSAQLLGAPRPTLNVAPGYGPAARLRNRRCSDACCALCCRFRTARHHFTSIFCCLQAFILDLGIFLLFSDMINLQGLLLGASILEPWCLHPRANPLVLSPCAQPAASVA